MQRKVESRKVKKIDFAKAKEEGIVLRGLVRMCEKIDYEKDKFTQNIRVDCGKNMVIIESDEISLFPYGRSPKALVGEEVDFIVKEYIPSENLIFGSMKMAEQVKQQPILDRLYEGETMEGTVVYVTRHGAYISIDGVQCFMRNVDFSNDGKLIEEFYPKMSKIKIKYKKTSKQGVILVEPLEKKMGIPTIDINEIEVGQVHLGKITGAYPDRIYVNITAGIDCMCRVPDFIFNLMVNEHVAVLITKIIKKGERIKIRGKIINKINN